MAIGLIGRKCGMTRVFTEDGASVPVTAIHVDKNWITQLRTVENDGYTAVQLAAIPKKQSRTNKPTSGHFAKANVRPCRVTKEFRVSDDVAAQYSLGDELTVALFQEGQLVDVAGITKGKGFAGTIKRYNFAMGDATHGNSKAHRSAGSIGQNQDPGRVFKGKKMAGQMGNVQRTQLALEVVRVDKENGVILVKGSIPGATGGELIISPSARSANNDADNKEAMNNAG